MKVRKITPRKWVFSEDRNITPLKYVKISQTYSMSLQWHHLFILLDLIYLHFSILREKWATVDKNPLKCLGTPFPVNYPKYDPWMTPMPEQDCWIHTASARVDIYAQRSHSHSATIQTWEGAIFISIWWLAGDKQMWMRQRADRDEGLHLPLKIILLLTHFEIQRNTRLLGDV